MTSRAPLLAGLAVETMQSKTKVSVYTCMVGWNQLQVEPFGDLTDNNPIDVALASGKPFRTRLNFGRYSPTFLAALGANAIPIHDPTDGVDANVYQWWLQRVYLAQSNLITRLAERYDSLLSAIFMGSNMTIYCEPFIRQVGSNKTRLALLSAGYTTSQDHDSYSNMFDMFSAFRITRPALAFNPYQTIDPLGSASSDVAYTLSLIENFRRAFPDGIIQNNSIRNPPLAGNYAPMYAAMKNNKPVSFQTATAARVGGFAKTLEWAIAQGAHLVELSPGFEQELTPAQLAHYDAALKANA